MIHNILKILKNPLIRSVIFLEVSKAYSTMEVTEENAAICVYHLANEVPSYARNVCMQSGCGNVDRALKILHSEEWN